VIYYLGLKSKTHSGEELVAKIYTGVENLLMLLNTWWSYTKIIYIPAAKLSEIDEAMQNNLYRIKRGGKIEKKQERDYKRIPKEELKKHEEEKPIKEIPGEELSTEEVLSNEEDNSNDNEGDNGVGNEGKDIVESYDSTLLTKDGKSLQYDTEEEDLIKAYDDAEYLHWYAKEGIENNEEEKEAFETLTRDQLSKVTTNISF
jgi:hypothetical protein